MRLFYGRVADQHALAIRGVSQMPNSSEMGSKLTFVKCTCIDIVNIVV